MSSKIQIPDNAIFVRKDSAIGRVVDNVDFVLRRDPEVQLRCAGTAVEKAILVAEKCVAEGIAQYSRFTTQMVPHDGRQVLYTIIKMKRAPVVAKKSQNTQKKQQKQPTTSNNQKRQGKQEYNNRKHSQDQYESEKNRREAYNDDHRERNERREQERYREGNNEKGQRNNQRNNNEPNRRDRDYR